MALDLKLFDAYERRARVFPAIIVTLPIGVTLWCAFSWEGITIGGTTGVGIVFLALLYAASMLVRTKGRELETRLMEQWGQMPSTIIMRLRNGHLGTDLKVRYHDAVRTVLDLPMPAAEEELADPATADARIRQAFDQVRGLLREHDPKGLWYWNNCDYGFQRNLLGSRSVWLVSACVSLIITGVMAYISPGRLIIGGLLVNFLLCISALYLGWSVLPRGVEFAAFRYAESAWEAFLNMSTRKG